MSLHPTSRDWRLAADDFLRGMKSWQIWTLMGVSDIRQRYKRSRFGQFWITLSMAVFVAGIGVVFSLLFKQSVAEYVPYLAVNYIIWTFMSGVVSDSTTAFVQGTVFLRQENLPKTIFVMRVIVRNLIALAHNIVIVPPVFLLFGVVPDWGIFLMLPGFALLLVASFLVTLLCGILCTRFRDLPQIIANLLQLAFFITPIMWRVSQLDGRGWYVTHLNPFAVFLRIVTDPIHGKVPELYDYGAALTVIAVLTAVTWPLFARFRARIVYWL
ncbi:lipopolysaccharide transport system permease protein [Pseudochelatococcus lubricantis]|uniref:Lipopolysaccharide transport system permease protein n=1 Tax=Pseudochelatococcus lubricantis TaxID=1538102 RepID=A0ABX0UWM0_9HYPH|nr:ABC transporter permease [Pseudochelatococcus lubricantis]NIJ56274.1 lipopolysaccharide transport system permease protein [Pseudochelatococcus lubricantis]